MAKWRRRIPIVASSGAALMGTVAACGGGGGGGIDDAIDRWADAYCTYAAACDEYFSDYYVSVAACEREFAEEIEEEFAYLEDEGVSRACIDRIVDYYDCIVSQYDEDACGTYVEGACEDEYYAAYDAWGDIDFRSSARTGARARRIASH